MIHSHSNSYKKYKNEKCRYHFGKFFTERTIVAKLLPKHMSDRSQENILKKGIVFFAWLKAILMKT